MASSIDPAVPAEESALASAPVRANFSAAKSEIEALQSASPIPIDYAVMRIGTEPVETADGATWLRAGVLADPEDYPLATTSKQLIPTIIPVDTPAITAMAGSGNNVVMTGTGDGLVYSANGGTTWTAATLPSSGTWDVLAYGGGVFVAIKASSTAAAYSDDGGATWTAATLPSSGSWFRLAYGDGVFVAIKDNSDAAAYSDDGGATWTAATLPSSGTWNRLAYGDGAFVVIKDNSDAAAYSDDGGATWTAATLPSSGNWVGLAYGDGVFAVIREKSNAAAYSDDGGATWTAATTPFVQSVHNMVYGSGKFVTLTFTYTVDDYPWVVLYSDDLGVSWKNGPLLPPGDFWRTAFAANDIIYFFSSTYDFYEYSQTGLIYPLCAFSADGVESINTVNEAFFGVSNQIDPVAVSNDTVLVADVVGMRVARIKTMDLVGINDELRSGAYQQYVRVA
jgi:hypothetical protein